jgi:hypothetical protein
MSSFPPLDPWGSQQQPPQQQQQQQYPHIAPLTQDPPSPQQQQHYPPQQQQQHQEPMVGYYPPATLAGLSPAPGFPVAGGGTYQHQQQAYSSHQHAHPPAPPPTTAAAAHSAEIDGRYVMPRAVSLVMQEMVGLGGVSADHFSVADAQTGAVWFRQAASVFSARGRRALLDGTTGAPVCAMRAKTLSLKPTWLVYRGGSCDDASALVASVRAHVAASASASVYLNDGDDESDYKLRGDFRCAAAAVIAGGRGAD